MKFLYLPLVLCITCITHTWEALDIPYQLSQLQHRSLKKATIQERDSEGLPPGLNTTEYLCAVLSFPAIASSFSEGCGEAFARLEDSPVGSEDEKNARRDVCTVDCGAKLVQFIAQDCQQRVLANSLVVLCAESNGVPCHYITNSYNWTAMYTQCSLSPLGTVDQCPESCSESVWSAVKVVGCCTKHDHYLDLWVDECGLNMPEDCLEPFKDFEKEKEEVDKTLDEGRADGLESSSAGTETPISLLSLSVLTLLCTLVP